MPRGFASHTKEKLKQLSAKGGTEAQAGGKGHSFNQLNAREAALKGVAKRKAKAAKLAAMRLIEQGFSAEHLALLELNVDELIQFGGSKATHADTEELLARLKEKVNG